MHIFWLLVSMLSVGMLPADPPATYNLSITGVGEHTSEQHAVLDFGCDVEWSAAIITIIVEFHWPGVVRTLPEHPFVTFGSHTWRDPPSMYGTSCGACTIEDTSHLFGPATVDAVAVAGLFVLEPPDDDGPMPDDALIRMTIRVVAWPVPRDPDLTGDGVVDGHDLLVLLSKWGSACADLNGDGTTGGADHWSG